MSPPLSRIRVFVEEEAVTIWSWARVRHALNWYSEEAYRDVLSGRKVVCDAAGHRVDLDGALQDGTHFLLRAGRACNDADRGGQATPCGGHRTQP
jgi:hypothetical protein